MKQLPDESRPPLFPRWIHWYLLVAALLLLQILLYARFTYLFS